MTADITPIAAAARLAFTVDALRAATGLGRSKIYEQVRAGRLRAIKIGGRTMFRREDVERWLASAPEKTTPSAAV